MITVKQAITNIVAEKLREYYLHGIRDARIEDDTGIMPSVLEPFDGGDFDHAPDKHVWIKIADDMLDI
jgi:hypothetical protein